MAGVFGLKRAYNKQRVDNWPESANYGYFAGGESSGVFNTIYRIDFSNETVSAPEKNLPLGKSSLTAVSSSNYGYFVGGYSSPPTVYRCTIDRLDFSNETVAVPPVDNQLTKARSALAAVSNSNYGYFGGGFFTPPSTRYSIIDRLDFYSETVSAPPGLAGSELTEGRNVLTAVSSSNYGYFAGGFAPPYVCTIDRIDFSSETVVGPPIHEANLTQARSNSAAVSSSNYGYFGGGSNPSVVNTIDRIDFSSETVSLPGPSLPLARNQLAAVSNSNYGYFGGGSILSAVDTIDRIDFSNETTSAPGNDLPAVRNALATVSGGKRINARGGGKPRGPGDGKKLTQYGYFGGGSNPTPSIFTSIDRLDVSNETVMELTNSTFTEARYYSEGLFSSHYGYFCGGGDPDSGLKGSNITRIDFSNEVTRENDSFQVPTSVGKAGYFNTPTYGYLAGGIRPTSPAYPTAIDKLDYSTESFSSGGNLYLGRAWTASFTTPNYGFVCGGFYTPGNTRTAYIDRFDLSTETSSNAPYTLPTGRRGQIGLSSNEYGYVAGGANPTFFYGEVYRINYNADTISPVPGVSGGMQDGASFNSAKYGYIAAGNEEPLGGSPSIVNKIYRMEYYTETCSSSTGINLSQAKANLGGLSN